MFILLYCKFNIFKNYKKMLDKDDSIHYNLRKCSKNRRSYNLFIIAIIDSIQDLRETLKAKEVIGKGRVNIKLVQVLALG